MIEAPLATAENPLVLKFVLDASLIPEGTDASAIEVFRDDAPMEDCAANSGTAASPDPRVSERNLLGDGDVELVVRTSHASVWNMGCVTTTPSQMQVKLWREATFSPRAGVCKLRPYSRYFLGA